MDEPERKRVAAVDDFIDNLPRSDLLEQIVDRLPVGLTVQDEVGRLILANRAAATGPRFPAVDVSGGDHPVSLRQACADIVEHDGRTFLCVRHLVEMFNQRLVISSSLDVSELRRAQRDMARRAYFDELTGLPNRALLERRVEQAVRHDRRDRRFALALIDLDSFKHINDYYSPAIGDALLAKVARRISDRITESDLLARITGDEFVLLIDAADDEQQLQASIAGITEALRQPFYIDGFEVFTSASIGVSIFPDHGRSFEALRRSADSAMYRAKHTGKRGAAFFDGATGRAVTARIKLEQRLRLAIRDRSFRCAFQPKVDIRTEEVVGLEALIRWRDERGTINPPGDFIALAIELGLIDPISHFILEETAGALDRINETFGAQTMISINVAAKQAGDLRFMLGFTQALRDTGCPDRFMIEVTEDAFVAKGQFQTEVLPLLREVGARVSIDDFGTGYSSLSALADITVDEVKVDRSFIAGIHQRPRSQSVLKAIESLSVALGMNVVAEGVETFEELAYLQAATRIRVAQGYYFARPFFLEEMGSSRGLAGLGRSRDSARERAEGRVRSSARPEGAIGRR
jgi:diguanylate cyclase (GGDEF)-like protein